MQQVHFFCLWPQRLFLHIVFFSQYCTHMTVYNLLDLLVQYRDPPSILRCQFETLTATNSSGIHTVQEMLSPCKMPNLTCSPGALIMWCLLAFAFTSLAKRSFHELHCSSCVCEMGECNLCLLCSSGYGHNDFVCVFVWLCDVPGEKKDIKSPFLLWTWKEEFFEEVSVFHLYHWPTIAVH